METSFSMRLYPIQSEPSHFYTGKLKDGTQVFMSVDYPRLFMAEFSARGDYLKVITRDISQESLSAIKESFNETYGESMWHKFNSGWEELDDWATEIGVTKGVIAVKKFCLPEYELCINDFPDYLQESLDSTEEIDEDLMEIIQEWQARNGFVLVWGQEYYMKENGEVEST